MKKTTALAMTPSPTVGSPHTPKSTEGDKKLKSQFYMATLNMSWQLLLVVLIPVIAGVQLDKKFDTSPVFTIVGFIIALAGVVVVVWRQMQRVAPTDTEKGPRT